MPLIFTNIGLGLWLCCYGFPVAKYTVGT